MLARSVFIYLFALFGGILLYFVPLGIPLAAQTVLVIAFVGMVLWITEVIPLHVTALLVGFLLILLVPYTPEKVFSQYFDKVVVLVLGGFALAVAMRRHALDEYFSQKLLGGFARSPNMLILGALSVTAFISLWISNSAAAALAMPLIIVILKKNQREKGKSNFAKAMVIAVAYGATIGGMGTLIGSTPNVLAQKFLTQAGLNYGFLEWGWRALPFTIMMVVLAWIVLIVLFKPEKFIPRITPHIKPFTRDQKYVGMIFFATVALWVTEAWHGIPNSLVALLPIFLLSIFRLITVHDFKEMGWDSLILIGGGIALGMAIDSSGLSSILAGQLGNYWQTQPYFIVLLAIGVVGVGLTSFISNTAASAIFLPIIASLAGLLGADLANLVTVAALAVSMDFILPMGTPPTAIACATNYIHPRDIMKSGVILSAIGIVVLALVVRFTW
jgi:sodium-dependent dicarboxylate transporter 2/3/5